MKDKQTCEHYLLCEHRSIYFLLMISSGILGAYTFTQRGGVFCNAQTANVVMMSIAFGQGRWRDGFYYIIPICAYLLGAFVSEILPSSVKKHGSLRWDTLLIGIEMAVLFAVGFIPSTADHKITQVIINFLASMQYNTFRQAEGIPMATTFCTNHIRQLGNALARAVRKHDKSAMSRFFVHLQMLAGFLFAGILLSFLGQFFAEKSIWLALIPLGIVFGKLLYADLKTEHNELAAKPHGH